MQLLNSVAYYAILGKPVVFYLGILTILSFLSTAAVATFNKKGNHIVPFKFHPWMARFSIGLAIIHGLLAVSAYF